MLGFTSLKKLKINTLNSRRIFSYKDPFLLEKQLTDDEKSIKDLAHTFSKDYLSPNRIS
jgi:hypothetical protein